MFSTPAISPQSFSIHPHPPTIAILTSTWGAPCLPVCVQFACKLSFHPAPPTTLPHYQSACVVETLFHSASLIFSYPFTAFSKPSSLRDFLKSSPSSLRKSLVVISKPFSSSFLIYSPTSPHHRPPHHHMRRPVAHGHKLPGFPASSRVHLKVIPHCSHVIQDFQRMSR